MKLIDGRPMWDFRASMARGWVSPDEGAAMSAAHAAENAAFGGHGASSGSGGGYDGAPVSNVAAKGDFGGPAGGTAIGAGVDAFGSHGSSFSKGSAITGPDSTWGNGAGAPATAYASLQAPKSLMEEFGFLPGMNAPVAAPPAAAPVGAPPGSAGFAGMASPGFGGFGAQLGVMSSPLGAIGTGNPGTIGSPAQAQSAQSMANAATVGEQSGIGVSQTPGSVGANSAPSAPTSAASAAAAVASQTAGGKDQSQAPSMSGAPAPTGISVPGMNYGGAVPGVGSGLMSFALEGPVSASPGSPALGLAEVPSGANASLAPAGASAPAPAPAAPPTGATPTGVTTAAPSSTPASAPAPAAVAAQEYGTPAPASSLTMETNTGLAVPNKGGGVDFAIDTQLTPMPGVATAIDAIVGMVPGLGLVNAASGLLGYGSIGSAMAANPHNEAWETDTNGGEGGPGWMDSATSDYDRGLTTSPEGGADADAKLRNDIFYRLDLYTSGVSPFERFHASRQPYRSV